MEKNKLEQYTELVSEVEDMKRRIKNTEMKLKQLCQDTVADSVTLGKHGKRPLGRKVIRGTPLPIIARKRAALRKYKAMLEEKEAEATEMIVDVQRYIGEIDDSRIRRILQYRYIDRMTWLQVAMRMGKHHTAESCRNAAERYLGKRK